MKAHEVCVGYSIKLHEKGRYFTVKQIVKKVEFIEGQRTDRVVGIIFLDVCGSRQPQVHPDKEIIISPLLAYQLRTETNTDL